MIDYGLLAMLQAHLETERYRVEAERQRLQHEECLREFDRLCGSNGAIDVEARVVPEQPALPPPEEPPCP